MPGEGVRHGIRNYVALSARRLPIMFYASFIHDTEEAEAADQSRLISASSKLPLLVLHSPSLCFIDAVPEFCSVASRREEEFSVFFKVTSHVGTAEPCVTRDISRVRFPADAFANYAARITRP